MSSGYVKKRSYTKAAMCFILFVWLGAVIALYAMAVLIMQ